MNVATGQTAQQLAEVIAGPGVQVFNASITGDPIAIGYFSQGATPLGMGVASGVIMASGDVQDASGAANNFASSVIGSGGDPYLEQISGEISNDAIILQFEFIPNADYVQFKYVFGSEEYPEWVCSSFNDMFAFTIQGVTVAMPQTNIALIPGTSIPVGINTINDDPTCGGNYSQYYVDNANNTVVAYDGLTTLLIAETPVICGETYRLRLMLSDGGDSSFDSGCFIAENSLTTGSVTVETATAASDSTAYEGCSDATVTLTLNGPAIAQDFPVPIWISNMTADWGVDFLDIPELNVADSTIIIPAGQNSVTFTVTPVNDNISEPAEYIEFIVITSTCGLTDTFRIYISDLLPITTTTSNDTTICIGNAIVWCEADGGGGLFTYTWDNGFGVATTIFPAPTQTTTYTVSVTDNCGSTAVTDEVTVTVDDGPTPFAGNDISVCIGGGVLLNASSDEPNCTFLWDPPTDLSNINIPNPLCTPQADMEYVVTVTRSDGCSNTDTVEVTLSPPPTAEFILPATGCAGEPLLVHYNGNANAAAQYQWNWDGGVVTNGSGMGPYAVLWTTPGIYTVELLVAWGGCLSTPETNQIVILGAPPVNAGSDVSFCSEGSAAIGTAPVAGITYLWSPINGVDDPSSSQTTLSIVNPTHDIQFIDYVLMAEQQGCKSYDTLTATVFPIPTAEFAIPDGKCFNVNSFDLLAAGYFGPNATFSWNFGPVGFPASSTLMQPEGVIFNVAGPQDVTLVVTDNGCVSEPFVGTIDVYEMPDAQFTANAVEGCEPMTVTFQDQSYNGNSALSRTWVFGDGSGGNGASPSHVYEAGVYNVKLSVVTSEGCADQLTKNNYIIVHQKPDALFSLSSQVLDIIDPTVVVTNLADSVAVSEFTFQPFNDVITGLEVEYTYPDTGVYTISQIVTTPHGCMDTISADVEVNPHYTLYIPNAFTPDNNGLNEKWIPQGESILFFSMIIYDRWDMELFQSASLDNGWDGTYKGKKLPVGVYTYRIDVIDILHEPHRYFGTFTLVR